MWDGDDMFSNITETSGIDMYEKNGNVVIEAPLPGIKPEDVHVTYEDGVLTIKAESKEEQNETKDDRVVYKKERVNSFHYTTTLPRPVDSDKMSADIADGVITILAPVIESAKQKKIEVTRK